MQIKKFIRSLNYLDKYSYIFFRIFDKIIEKNILYQLLKSEQSTFTELEKKGVEINLENGLAIVNLSLRNKVMLRLRESDVKVCEQVFLKEEYRGVIELWNNLFSTPPNIIMDVGANIGMASLFFLSKFSECRLIAIEPDENNFKMLQGNLENYTNCVFINKALWNKNIQLSIKNDFRDGRSWATSVSEIDVKDKYPTVASVTFDELMLINNIECIDILKIDIEGAEKQIFSNESDLTFLEKVKILALEIHDEVIDRNIIYKILNDNHFFHFDSGETTLAVHKKWIRLD